MTAATEAPIAATHDRPAGEAVRLERASIDASARTPVLTFYAFALFWLMASSVLALVNCWKLLSPEFLGGWSWLTYGRLQPVQENALLYGWAAQAGIGTAIWLMARLSRVQIRYPLMVTFGALLWNLGVLLGSIGIMAGDSTSVKWLEYPPYAAWLMFVGYVAIGIWGLILYRLREKEHIFVSQWFLVAAFVSFPWLFATANLMLFSAPVAGPAQPAVHWWYSGNLIGLWLTSLGLGAAYYMIPKVTGRPIYSYNLAAFGFWTFLLFFSWRGSIDVSPGPLPAWVQTVGAAASLLALIPIATIALNHHITARGSLGMMHFSPTLRFVVFGSVAFTASGVIAALMALRPVADILGFTWATVGYTHLVIYTFFSMVMFGSMYFIVPRLVGCEWRSASLIKLHFWGAAYGSGLLVLMLFVGGLTQGADLLDGDAPFIQSLVSTLPFLRGRMLASVMLLLGHALFALHFVIMILRLGHPGGTATRLSDEEGAH